MISPMKETAWGVCSLRRQDARRPLCGGYPHRAYRTCRSGEKTLEIGNWPEPIRSAQAISDAFLNTLETEGAGVLGRQPLHRRLTSSPRSLPHPIVASG